MEKEQMDQNQQANPIEMLAKITARAAARNDLKGVADSIMKCFGFLDQAIGRLYQLIMSVGQSASVQGSLLEVVRMNTKLLESIIIEKGIISKEEFNERYIEVIQKPLEKAQEEARMQLAQAMAEIEAPVEDSLKDSLEESKQTELPNLDCKCSGEEKCNSECKDPNVILASERFKKENSDPESSN